MIKSVSVVNNVGDYINLPLANPYRTGMAILSIEGLGPVKANIITTDIATNDGAIYNSARLPARNIIFTIQLLGTPSIEETRQKIYKYFPIKKKIGLVFETDTKTVTIMGYVESDEPDIFSKNETTKISIICPNPYFQSGEDSETSFYGVEPLFEFPFENVGLVPALEFGSIYIKTEQTIYYEGEVEIGVNIKIHFVGTAEDISIVNLITREIMSINTDKITQIMGEPLKAGDDILISTVKGEKYIRLIRDGEVYNIINCLDKNADWFTLKHGDNIFAYTASSGGQNMRFSINNRVLYEGI